MRLPSSLDFLVATRLVDTPDDAKQVVPILDQLQQLRAELGSPLTVPGNAGLLNFTKVALTVDAGRDVARAASKQRYMYWCGRIMNALPLA